MEPQSSSRSSLTPAPALLVQSFSSYASLFPFILTVNFIPAVLFSLDILIGYRLSPLANSMLFIAAYLAGIVSYAALVAGITEESLVHQGLFRSLEISYKKGIRLIFPFLWVGLLMTLVTLGGTLLLIVPGILFALWLSLSPYILFVEDKRGLKALITSWHYVKGYWLAVFWRFLFFGLVFFAIALVAVLAFIITGLIELPLEATSMPQALWSRILNMFLTSFLLTPLSLLYGLGIYQSARRIKAVLTLFEEEEELKKRLIILAALGVVALGVIIGIMTYYPSLAGA